MENISSEDKDLQNKAYLYILEKTDTPVGWAYEIWNEMLEGLTHKDNHVRAISAQVLSNLAKSDPKNRMLEDFDKLLEVTKDKKQQKVYMEGLERRFKECISEKNCTLMRYDILQSMRNVYDEVQDEKIKEKALELIDTEEDPKYRKKYASLWKK